MRGISYSPVVGVLVGQVRQRGGQVHGRVPAHVGHVQEQHVDGVGIAARGVGDHHVHQAVGRERRVPAEGLVDALRRARGIDQQVVGAGGEAQVRARQRLAGLHVARLAARLEEGRRQLRVGRLVAEAAGAIDRAQQDLQDVQDAAGVEAVGVGRDAAHGVHADGAADHLVVAAAEPVGPGDVEGDLLLEGGVRQLGGDAADGGGGDARLLLGALGRIRRRRGTARRAAGTPAPPRARRRGGRCRTSTGATSAPQAARERARLSCRAPADCRRRRGRTGRRRRRRERGSPARARWCSARGSRDRSAAVVSSSWISAATNSPSVPGLMPIHSSAMAL